MNFKKLISFLLCISLLTAGLPANAFAQETSGAGLMGGITEKKYSSSAVNAFSLRDSAFNIDTTKSQTEYSVSSNFTEKRSGDNVRMFNLNSAYPLGYRSYESNSRDSSDSSWYQWSRWKLTSEEKSLLAKLTANDGNVEIGGKYDGHIDTQASAVKGLAYMGIEQNYLDDSDKATKTAYTEKKMSDSDSKDKLITKAVEFQKIDPKTNSFYVVVGGTKGNWFGKSKNYAEVHYPQVFFRDVVNPKIDSVEISGGTSYAGKYNFVNGDRIRVKVKLSEPIRVSGSYDEAFVVSADGFSDFTAVEYNEVDYEKAELHFEAEVTDSSVCRNFSGKFSASAKAVSGKVKDLAGNVMDTDSRSSVRDDVVIDGYLPRINQAYIESILSRNEHGDYVESKNQKTIIKPGDYLVFRVGFNQTMRQSGKIVSTFPVNVEGLGSCDAFVRALYKGGSLIRSIDSSNSKTYAINSDFDAVSYIVQIPENVQEGAKITFPASREDFNGKAFWSLDSLSTSLGSTYGNVQITSASMRKKLQERTEIVAVEGEDSIFEMTVDRTAPGITLTNLEGNCPDGVFASPQEADIRGEKKNNFRVYFKSEETVEGSVKAELKYISQENPLEEIALATEYCGAYTGSNIIEDMCVDFSIPPGFEIDSADYDIFIETTAFDEIYNKSVQRFYLAADTKPPEVSVSNGYGHGELVKDGENLYWNFDFDVEDRSTPDGRRLYYKFDPEDDYKFTDESTGFTVKTAESPLGVGSSGTVIYYVEDACGNKSGIRTANYYISDQRSCRLSDPENVLKYLSGRDVYFTGFKAPENDSVGTVYDFLVYRINGGEFKYIKNTDGNDLHIPKNELSDNCIITYKLIRASDDTFYPEMYAEEYSTVYHCDDINPSIAGVVTLDAGGNASALRIGAPDPYVFHPKNIIEAQIRITGKTQTADIDGSSYIRNGIFYANLNLHEILRERNLPSGKYTVEVMVTDSNGHTGVYRKELNVIIDAPKTTNIRVYSAYDEPFDSDVAYMGYAADATQRAEITAATVNNLIHSGASFTHRADAYRVEADLKMRFEGDEYPKLDTNDVWYTVSEDGGRTWTEYAQADLENTDAQIIEENGEGYAVYKVSVPLTPSAVDGAKEYRLRFKAGVNTNPGDISEIITQTDTTPPDSIFMIDSVGSDENGWSKEITYTNEYVKYRYAGVDKDGFLGTATIHQIKRITDKNGNEVSPENYQEYLQIVETGDVLDYVIVKQRCRVEFTISDFWGNSVNSHFECLLIDDVKPEYRVYTENTDEYAYLAVANVSAVEIGATEPGTLEMTEEAKSTYRALQDSATLTGEIMGNRPAMIQGTKIEIQRFRQEKLAEKNYDIIGTIYDKSGNPAETFKISEIVSSAPDITLISSSGTASGLGKAIRAVETMQFNIPVAQLTGESLALIKESGPDAAASVYTGNLVFSHTLNAVVDAETGSEVYVIDKLGRAMRADVDTQGTEFVKFAAHSVAYYEINTIGTTARDESFIYGNNSGVRIEIDGHLGAAIKPQLSGDFRIGTDSVADNSGSEYEGYYSVTVIEAPAGFVNTDGTAVIRYKVKNRTNLEEYCDAIILNTDNSPPVLLEAAHMRRADIYTPISVIYMFYDRYGIISVSTDSGSGFEENYSVNGIAISTYYNNIVPVIKAVDLNGNITEYYDESITDITVSHSLIEGRDYEIEIRDPNMAIAEYGKYYSAVYVSPVSVEGGKYFETSSDCPMYVDTEDEMIIELIDENGEKVIHRLKPPVDVSAPKIGAYQNNSGEYVEELKYTITVSDMRSGISRVYVRDENGQTAELLPIDTDNVNSYYEYVTQNTSDVAVVAVDNVGNESEYILSSNSGIVGPLEVYANQSVTGITNKNVIMSVYSADGRRIYTHIPEQPDGYLQPGEYVQSGNDIAFTKNGNLLVECVDDMSNTVKKLLSVSNIDKTPAVVTGTVSEIIKDDGNVSKSSARVTFTADGNDNRMGAVYLLYIERNGGEDVDVSGLKAKWEEYMQDPQSFVMTDEFKEVFDKLYKLDIHDPNTYVDVTSNGKHTFYLIDSAGNGCTATVSITILDETAPGVEKITWSFDSSAFFASPVYVSGESDVLPEDVVISKETTGFMTNNPVTVTFAANEPVRIFGSGSGAYSRTVSHRFDKNGIYDFVVEDESGNRTHKTVNVSNILKRDLFIEFGSNEIVVFRDQAGEFDWKTLDEHSVYTYNGNGEKVNLTQGSDCESAIDYGGFNPDDVNANVFDRNRPYILTYKAGDIAGNTVQRTRQLILADNTDTFVMVNGEVPNAASCVYTGDSELKISIANYGSKAVVKAVKGQLNGAQMKRAVGELTISDEGFYRFDTTATGEGWYTIGVRTLFQDIYVVWVYVG